jgi:superfamily II DNA or RNA helicase
MQLRDYQEKFILDIREAFKRHRRVLGVKPTGAGKTACFSYIAKGVQSKGKRVLVTAHRRELLKQISQAMDVWNVPHAILNADSRGMPRAPVIVASVFTFVNRMKNSPEFDLIICDEAHHASIGTTWSRVLNQFPKAKILGVTASPVRLDGHGLADNFDVMVQGPSVAELTAVGWLSPAEVYAPKEMLDLRGLKVRGGDYVNSELEALMDKPSITGNAVEHYSRMAMGKSAVAFCCSIQHAEDVAAEFRAAGITAEHIDGKMEDFQRSAALMRFKRGDTKILTSCDLVSEGFDMPSIEVAILLRPTKSLGLYLQQCGRAIRPSPGKTKTLILDHANNCAEHGFIDEPREWTLDAKDRKARAKTTPISTCPRCYAVHHPAPFCPRCGHEYVTRPREVAQFDGQLERISGPEDIQLAFRESEYAKSYNILLNVAKQRSMEKAHEWAFANVAAQYARDLARGGERQAQGYMINGLTLEERDRLMQMIRGTQNQIEMVV